METLTTSPRSNRDPRVTPKAGDVLRRAGGFFPFHVRRIDSDGSISGSFHARGMVGSLCGIAYWREKYADAEVIHNADDDARVAPVPPKSGEVIE